MNCTMMHGSTNIKPTGGRSGTLMVNMDLWCDKAKCGSGDVTPIILNPLNAELNPICYLLALLGAHHFLHVSRIRVKSLTFRLLMSYIQGVSRL